MNFADIICKLIGHQFKLIRRYSAVERKVYCARCARVFGMHDDVQALVEWNGVLAEMHGEYWPCCPKNRGA